MVTELFVLLIPEAKLRQIELPQRVLVVLIIVVERVP